MAQPKPPLDLILFLDELVADWNEESKCDLCWTFTAPMRESDLNEYQFKTYESPCCVLVSVTDYSFSTTRNYDRATTLMLDKYILHSFKLSFLVTDDLGKNVYNEIKNHDLSESKWATILKPIYDCVSEDDILDFCLKLGYNVIIESWSGVTRIDYLDNNYTGWTFNVRLRENLG